jgi:hypothetical protein
MEVRGVGASWFLSIQEWRGIRTILGCLGVGLLETCLRWMCGDGVTESAGVGVWRCVAGRRDSQGEFQDMARMVGEPNKRITNERLEIWKSGTRCAHQWSFRSDRGSNELPAICNRAKAGLVQLALQLATAHLHVYSLHSLPRYSGRLRYGSLTYGSRPHGPRHARHGRWRTQVQHECRHHPPLTRVA